MESDTNVGLGMVPHKKACRCLECENERHEAEIKDLKSKLQDWSNRWEIAEQRMVAMVERATSAEGRLDTMTKYSAQQSETIARGDAEIESLESSLDGLKHDVALAEIKEREANEEVQRLQSRLDSALNELRDCNIGCANAIEERDRLAGRLEAATKVWGEWDLSPGHSRCGHYAAELGKILAPVVERQPSKSAMPTCGMPGCELPADHTYFGKPCGKASE